MIIQRALSLALSLLTIFTTSTAVHLIKVIPPNEFIHRKITQPEDDFPLFRLPDSQLHHISFWLNRLSDAQKYPQVLGPCRPPGPLDYPHVSLNTEREVGYPLFPLDAISRNKILGRPDPETVSRNIEISTGGRLNTVDEVVNLVNEALRNLNVRNERKEGGTGRGESDLGRLIIPYGDDILTLLASNFHSPIAGLVVQAGCGPASVEVQAGLWAEDIFVSMDEQRALVAGALYVIGDRGYITRRDRDLRTATEKKGLEQRWDGEGDITRQKQERKVEETCQREVGTGALSFGERVEALDLDILMDEEDWVSRYEMIVSALRAKLYAMVPMQAWAEFESRIDEVVSAAEELAGKVIDEHIKNLIQKGKGHGDGFQEFLIREAETIRERYRPFELTEAVVRRIAYWRWSRQA
ncbi:hypothetical protein QBC37DRAFT_415661 [Rhypophila decipiens]|uniref:Uncharacterized protein n=1 Tax=Rhypophila decipiens TaxID=261697 RepID=A0AAN6YFZ8_9PEZI|nr:hypothetical protein QBC37DRAFT_415661 [Rhypophila decipiens]